MEAFNDVIVLNVHEMAVHYEMEVNVFVVVNMVKIYEICELHEDVLDIEKVA